MLQRGFDQICIAEYNTLKLQRREKILRKLVFVQEMIVVRDVLSHWKSQRFQETMAVIDQFDGENFHS